MTGRPVPLTEATDGGAVAHAAYEHLRADAIGVLTAWRAPSASQEAVRLDLLDHLSRHPAAMAKSGPPAHLTASCLVLSADSSQVLLTHHRKADRWFQLGGHYEIGDRGVRAAALREATEEGGIAGLRLSEAPVHLDRHTLVGSFGRCTEHLDIRYAAWAPVGALPEASAESHEVRWWPVDALPEDTRSELGPLVEAALATTGGGAGHPVGRAHPSPWGGCGG